MGLDISYYKNLKPVECDNPRECDHVHVYQDKHFAGREMPLVVGQCYEGVEVGDFRAGSYSGYNLWRENLAKLAGYPLTPVDGGDAQHAAACWDGATGPFCKLINFSDCEGTIGSEVSAGLAKDFAEFDDRAKAHEADDRWFYEKYRDWRKAFETAAEGGAVRFH